MSLFKKKKPLKTFLTHSYTILIVGLSLAFFFYLNTFTRPLLQSGVVILTGIFYVLWGMFYHAKKDEFHIKIILEYILIAFLAVTLLLTLIFRG
jgi:hypothetical protein